MHAIPVRFRSQTLMKLARGVVRSAGVLLAIVAMGGVAHADTRTFTSMSATADGQGYVLTADNGQTYAYGTIPHRGNPSGFTGRIVGIAATANGQGYASISSIGQVYAYGNTRHRGNPSGFSGEITDIAVTADGQGYIAVSSAGQMYAYGTVQHRGNPANFSGKIVRVAVTADGKGYMAVSSTGQFYAYGTVRSQRNPVNFTGDITDVSVTADGQGTVAVSSAGQLYAYGTAKAWPNPVNFTGRMVGVALTGNGQGLAAMSSSGQTYAYGTMVHRGNGDPGVTTGPVDTRYQQIGGSTSFLGARTSPLFATGRTYHGQNGLGQHFQGGSIYYSGVTGARVTHGHIRDKWASLGWEKGFLGLPISDIFGVRNGGLGQHFQGGSIYWTSSTGAHESHGSIRDKWSALNWENGFLGYPISDEFASGRGGRGQHFQGGSIYWGLHTGTHEVHGAIRDKWAALGWENGYLGLPISDEMSGYNGQVRVSHFLRGDIYWNAATGASDYLPHNVQDPVHTQGTLVSPAPPGHRSYSYDLPLDRTGYLHIPAKPVLAFNELLNCFNCSFPVPGAPATFPAQGQLLQLDACPFQAAGLPCKAPVIAYTNGKTFIRYTSVPGHFDGVDATVTFTFYDNRGSLFMNVTGYIIDPVVPEALTKNGAQNMWVEFAHKLGTNIWLRDCHDGC